MTDSSRAVSAVVDHVFERYPQVGRRAGIHDLDARLPDLAPDSLSDVDGLVAAVSSIPDEHADPETRADLGAAYRVLAVERFRIADLGRPHRGPGEWLGET